MSFAVICVGTLFCDIKSLLPQLVQNLVKRSMNPVGAPGWTRFWLINMFSACTCSDVKDDTLKLFCLPESTFRNVNCYRSVWDGYRFVWRVIHWGPSENIKLYRQETGCAGWDGRPVIAVLYVVCYHYPNPDQEMQVRHDSFAQLTKLTVSVEES